MASSPGVCLLCPCAVFIMSTSSNFPDIMLPVYSCNRWFALFFIAYIVIGCYFILNLTLAVAYTEFKQLTLKKVHARRIVLRCGLLSSLAPSSMDCALRLGMLTQKACTRCSDLFRLAYSLCCRPVFPSPQIINRYKCMMFGFDMAFDELTLSGRGLQRGALEFLRRASKNLYNPDGTPVTSPPALTPVPVPGSTGAPRVHIPTPSPTVPSVAASPTALLSSMSPRTAWPDIAAVHANEVVLQQEVQDDMDANHALAISLRQDQWLGKDAWVQFFVAMRKRSSRSLWTARLLSLITCCRRGVLEKQRSQEEVRSRDPCERAVRECGMNPDGLRLGRCEHRRTKSLQECCLTWQTHAAVAG